MDKRQAVPEFIGWQQGYGFVADFPLFNYQPPNMFTATTVSKETLLAAGVPVPPHPTLEEWVKSVQEGGK